MDKYNENKLGRIAPEIKETKLSKDAESILAGNHDNDYIDPDKQPNIARINTKIKAKAMINWAELSRTIAGDRSAITKDRIPKKHQPIINKLINDIANWYIESQLGDSPKAGGAI